MIDDFKPAKQPKPIKLDLPPEVTGETTSKTLPKENLATGSNNEPNFKTPEEVAVDSLMGEAPAENVDQPIHEDEPKESRFKALIAKIKALDKKKKALIIVAIVVVLAGVGYGVYALTKSEPKVVTATKPIKKAPVVVKPITSPLTGVVVTKSQSLNPVTAVMIENSPDARPQSGLKDAGIVYEAIAEAGITRFMAVYQEAEPGNIGPVRSARPYYLRWALPYNAGYAHVGGSPDALADIKSLGIRDLDQFYNGNSYHRISSRVAPHNVYTSIADLRKLENDKGYSSSAFTSFARKADKASKTPNATSIDLAISGATYNVHYDYDAGANSYKRNEGGVAHMDADSGSQLEPHVVVALVMPYSLMSDGYHSNYNTIGTGRMFVFQDGIVTPGTWTKTDDKAPFTFTNEAGKGLELNAGQTWITALGDAANVTYK